MVLAAVTVSAMQLDLANLESELVPVHYILYKKKAPLHRF